MCVGTLADHLSTRFDLLPDQSGVAPIRTEGYVVAEGAATTADTAIPIGAGESGIYRDLVHVLSVASLHGLTKGIYILGKIQGVMIFSDSFIELAGA